MCNKAADGGIMKFRVGKAGKVIPSGKTIARVLDIKTEVKYKRKTLIFTFEVLNPKEFHGVELLGWVPAHYESFSSHTKLYKWHTAATGDELNADDEINLEVFMNKALIVEVVDRTSKKTKNKFSNVSEIVEVHHETL